MNYLFKNIFNGIYSKKEDFISLKELEQLGNNGLLKCLKIHSILIDWIENLQVLILVICIKLLEYNNNIHMTVWA